MIARMWFQKTLPDFLGSPMEADAEKWRTQEYFPALRRQKGFIQVFLAIPDDPGDEAVEVELWESREALETWHKTKEFQEMLSRLPIKYAEPPTTKVYDEVRL